MAPEKKDKKRKAAPTATATVIDPPTKKSKKIPATATGESSEALPKSILKKKNTKEHTNGSTVSPAPKAKADSARKAKPRKRAADFLSDDDDSGADNTKPEIQKEKATSKAVKKQLKKQPADVETAADVKKSEKNKKSPNKNAEMAVVLPEESDEPSGGQDNEDEEEDLDDQTADLIRGFESSGDEDPSDDEGLDPDQPVPRIPDSKKAKRKILKKQKKSGETDEPGTVYVGRIPHGFYEHQMRAYFSQFGDITRLRLSRNRVTGSSKHYAFVEFASVSVAKIVAETMNNYLMYGHILKCKFVPQEQQHPDLWKGANRRFKRTPWNRIEKNRLERGKTREKWAKSIEQEEKRRIAKAEKLKALGYEFELPALKAVEDVPVPEKPKAIEDVNGAASDTIEAASNVKAIEAAEKHTDETPKKSSKKATKEKIVSNAETANTEEAASSPVEKAKLSEKKAKKSSGKGKKVKA